MEHRSKQALATHACLRRLRAVISATRRALSASMYFVCDPLVRPWRVRPASDCNIVAMVSQPPAWSSRR
eukprot:2605537-Prymnesium_polylepis.1